MKKSSADKIKIPLFDLKLSSQAKTKVNQVLRSGWLNSGPMAAKFEQELAKRSGVRYAAVLNSASSALQLTLEAIGTSPGREVVTSPFTFVATASAILRTGAYPVLADIQPDSLNLDPDEVARKCGDKTVAVMPVDVAGFPADYKALKQICADKGLPIISDASHSFGAKVGRKSIAQVTDAAIHSFQVTKNLTTADGGAILSRHKQLVERVRLLSRQGMSSTAYDRKVGGGSSYDVVALGAKANLSDVHAAIGLGQLERFDRDQAKRTQLALRYNENLAELHELLETPLMQPHATPAWHLYISRLHLSGLKVTRDQLVRKMAALGIECGVHYRPLFEMTYYRNMGLSAQYFPNAAYAGQRVMSLPLYPSLKISQVDYICDCLSDLILKSRR